MKLFLNLLLWRWVISKEIVKHDEYTGTIDVVRDTTGALQVEEEDDYYEVVYECTLYNLWTKDRHPIDFPSDPRWSSVVLVVHNSDYSLFSLGERASEEFKDFMETGSSEKLIKVLEEKKEEGSVKFYEVGTSFKGGTMKHRTMIRDIPVDEDRPYVSLAMRMEPSPDWFIGGTAHMLNDGRWYSVGGYYMYPLDAGIYNGVTYTERNEKTDDPINVITQDTLQDTGVLLSPNGLTILAVVSLNFVLTNPPVVPPCNKNYRRCGKDSVCCLGTTCQEHGGKNKKCLPLLELTQACTRSKDCYSRNCKDGTCVMSE